MLNFAKRFKYIKINFEQTMKWTHYMKKHYPWGFILRQERQLSIESFNISLLQREKEERERGYFTTLLFRSFAWAWFWRSTYVFVYVAMFSFNFTYVICTRKKETLEKFWWTHESAWLFYKLCSLNKKISQ